MYISYVRTYVRTYGSILSTWENRQSHASMTAWWLSMTVFDCLDCLTTAHQLHDYLSDDCLKTLEFKTAHNGYKTYTILRQSESLKNSIIFLKFCPNFGGKTLCQLTKCKVLFKEIYLEKIVAIIKSKYCISANSFLPWILSCFE